MWLRALPKELPSKLAEEFFRERLGFGGYATLLHHHPDEGRYRTVNIVEDSNAHRVSTGSSIRVGCLAAAGTAGFGYCSGKQMPISECERASVFIENTRICEIRCEGGGRVDSHRGRASQCRDNRIGIVNSDTC